MTPSRVKALPDEELVARYLETQDGIYFNTLYDKYAGKVFGKCISLLKNEFDATDATQDIFMKILLKMSTFGGQSKFSTWIYSITYNYCIDRIRRQKKEQMVTSQAPEELPEKEVSEVSDAQLLEVKVLQLKKVLDEMNSNDKVILLMKYQDGLSITEISEMMKLSESAVKMRIKRAKHKFKLTHEKTFKSAQ